MLEKLIRSFPEKIRREIYQISSIILFFILSAIKGKNRFGKQKRITIVDFRYAGNLRSFYNYTQENNSEIEFGFLPVDPNDLNYLRTSLPDGIKVLSRFSYKDMLWALDSKIFLTSIMMRRFLILTKFCVPHINFIQVFHSMNLLGEPLSWFNAMKRFDKVFCSSEWTVNKFEEITGSNGMFIPTGYAVMDGVISSNKNKEEIVKSFGLTPSKKLILIAPTLSSAINWEDGDNIYLYDRSFLEKLDDWAQNNEIQIIFRNHPHEAFDKSLFKSLKTVFLFDSKKYRDVFEQLHIADLMITDLSGIGAYFMSLKKPIIFINSNPRKTDNDLIFFISQEELPGPIIRNTDEFFLKIEEYIKNNWQIIASYEPSFVAAFEKLYGKCFDGNSSKRYADFIDHEFKKDKE